MSMFPILNDGGHLGSIQTLVHTPYLQIGYHCQSDTSTTIHHLKKKKPLSITGFNHNKNYTYKVIKLEDPRITVWDDPNRVLFGKPLIHIKLISSPSHYTIYHGFRMIRSMF